MLFLVLGGFRYFVVWEQITNFFYINNITYDLDRKEIVSRSYKIGKLKNRTSIDYRQLQSDIPAYKKFREHAHYPRAILMSPVIYLSYLLGVSYHLVFSILIVFLISLTAVFMQRIYEFNNGTLCSSSIFCLLIGLVAFTSMNGRMIWGFLSASAIIYLFNSQAYLPKLRPLILSICVILFTSSISTGVFFFNFLLFLIFLFMNKKINLLSVDRIAYSLIALLIFLPYFLLAFYKNFTYFFDKYALPFRAIQNHGILGIEIVSRYIVLLIPITLYLCYRLLKTDKVSMPLKITFCMYLFSGFLGRGVFSMILIPLILIIFLILEKIFFNQKSLVLRKI